MGKGKTMAITAVATCGLAAALILAASMTNLFLAGDYYVKIDNAHISITSRAAGSSTSDRASRTYISLRRSTRRVMKTDMIRRLSELHQTPS